MLSMDFFFVILHRVSSTLRVGVRFNGSVDKERLKLSFLRNVEISNQQG